jgi:hypothetical protein
MRQLSLSLVIWLWMYLLLVIEAVLVLFATKLAFDFPEAGSRRFGDLEKALRRLANRRAVSVVAIIALAFLLRGLILPVAPIPEPGIHDEFSHLLAADTFAHGRLTNPTHPMWVHFESIHIEHRPSYASMYPPGQGMLLALGELLGNPFYGVWIMVALMCGAICWMLQGWLPPGWALFGAGLAVIRLATFSGWANSYMPGALPVVGGALVLGAMPRIVRHRRAWDAVVMGIGVALLVNTRPYEGGVVSAAAVSIVLYRLGRQGGGLRTAVWRLIVPLALVMIPTLAFMAYYNWRVFGNAFTLPYQVNRATYAVEGYFIWQAPRAAPLYRNQAMADYYDGWERMIFEYRKTVLGFTELCLRKLTSAWQFYLGPALTLPILVLPVVFKDRGMRDLLVVSGICILALFVEVWSLPQYSAPAAAAILAICIQALRHVRLWQWKGRPVGLALVRMIPLVCLAMLGIRIGISAFHLPVILGGANTWATAWSVPLGRARILSDLESHPGSHLVLVRYGPNHDPLREYVYNGADIDGSRVVWAREMSRQQNRALLEYFRGRQAWVLEADAEPPRLMRWNADDRALP